MESWNLIKSGGKSYSDHELPDGTHIVRRNDGFSLSTGTKLGQTDSMVKSLDIVKSDSGSSKTDIKKR